MSSDSAYRIHQLRYYNFSDTEEITVLKLFIKKASAEFKKPDKTKAQRDKIASEKMERRKRLSILMNDISHRNAELRSLTQ
jgi:hypothetical protein